MAVEYWTIIECETYTPAQQMITDKNEHAIIITTPSNCLTTLKAYSTVDCGRIYGINNIQRVLFHWASPKKLKYGKPRLTFLYLELLGGGSV